MRYVNLIGEMAKRKVTKEDLADCLDIHWNSASNKVKGLSAFSVDEAVKVKEEFFPELSIDFLFARDDPTDNKEVM